MSCIFDFSSVGALLNCLPTYSSSQVRDVFFAAIIHTVHSIWKAQNTIRLSQYKVSLHATKSSIISMAALCGNMSQGHCLPSDMLLLDSFRVAPGYRRFREIVEVTWKAHTAGWVKANTDGSVKASFAP